MQSVSVISVLFSKLWWSFGATLSLATIIILGILSHTSYDLDSVPVFLLSLFDVYTRLTHRRQIQVKLVSCFSFFFFKKRTELHDKEFPADASDAGKQKERRKTLLPSLPLSLSLLGRHIRTGNSRH